MAATYSNDIIIISDNQMKETVGQDYFLVLSENLQGVEMELYKETANNKVLPFGAVLSDESSFGKYYSGTQKCYAFISPQTENLYPVNTMSGEGNNATVIAWQWLMEKL